MEATLDRKLEVPCDLRRIEEAVGFVREAAIDAGASGGLAGTLGIAAEEAIANAIDHGSACKNEMNVQLRCMVKSETFWLVVRDFGGKPFNPDYFLRIATKKIWGKGGRGILMINQIMDSVTYVFRTGRSTTVYLSKSLVEESESEE